MHRRPIIVLPDEYLPEVEELPGNLRKIAEAIEECLPGQGTRITLILAQRFLAIPLYFRSVEKFLNHYRDERMRAEYDSSGVDGAPVVTALDLALKTGLGLRTVEKILARPASQEELESKQMRLF